MPFDSREYEFADLSLQLGNRDVTGFRSIKLTEKIEREALFAKGRHAHSVQSGNVMVEGEMGLLQSEYEALIKAGKGSLLNLKNLNAVVAFGNPSEGNTPMTKTVEGIYFTESSFEMKQGDKFSDITIPFIALRLKQ